ncbi:MAG: hypothetical protein A2566_01085 [Candidatus Zambryskibacteria bacterium RIFOXYD1_FULL_40_13]|nr:MAG: hypothetical protein UT25_C0001G0206 [Parcubacteria group bacterium GW2011_GWC1_39_12]KKR19730.1 MAG: hypothetical protein UT49_C0001G0206 [Parcubacteria group bacterium GW2011_GWF1_39_37]KKR35886.1 MAG: hypothetical protein UT68_C0001G0209 [Parcubacteria group bacterium GW2011_GWC2_40_10]KKR52698.1 MAG: hypothetical protein UT89_C0001G0206 [Parcubacteria group bacterium GW2011_GWE1_40_20]KKR66484.1 MAG: hypothetical protein UU06_C0001G0017 [Parcubacteria group bacterium GW2011_GWB1_40_
MRTIAWVKRSVLRAWYRWRRQLAREDAVYWRIAEREARKEDDLEGVDMARFYRAHYLDKIDAIDARIARI